MMNNNLIAYSCIKYMIDNNIVKINCFDLFNKYANKFIKDINQFINLCHEKLTDNFEIQLNNCHINVYEHIPYFLFHYYIHKEIDEESLSKKIKEIIENNMEDNQKLDKYLLYALIYSLDEKNNKISDYECIANYYINNIYLEKNINEIEDLISKIDYAFYDENIEWIMPKNSILNTIFSLYNIEKIRDLKDLSFSLKMLLCMYDVEELCEKLSLYCIEKRNIFYQSLSDVFLKTTPRCEKILRYRFGINLNKLYTLEEIAQMFSVTRERIRQLENKGLRHLHRKIEEKLPIIKHILQKICFFEKGYILKEELLEEVKDRETTDIIIMFLISSSNNSEYIYNDKYEILHNKELNIDNYIEEVINLYDYKIDEVVFNQLPERHKKILLKKYKKINGYYLNKSIRINKLIDYAIVNEFDGRLDINNEIQTNRIFKYLNDELASELNIRSLLSHIDRLDYLNIDKGIYLKTDKCLILPNDIKNQILKDIFTSNSSLYYIELYNKYKEELERIGINNKYYFKSLIDLELVDFSEEYSPTRDSIVKKGKYINLQQSIIESMDEYNGTVCIMDIKKLLPFVPESIILNILNNSNEILKLDKKRYISVRFINITEKEKDTLYKLVNNILNNSDLGIIGIKKIYSKLYYKISDFFEKYKFISNSFDMFSVLRYLFKNEFVFHRPLIALIGNENINIHHTMISYLSQIKYTTLGEFREFLNKTGIRNNNIMELIDDISDTMVLVDNNKLINKEVIEINETEIENVKKILNLILMKESLIHIKIFRKYNILPKLKYEWNKYLLYGIIKSYLDDEYDIEVTTMFDKFEYIIRRNKYE